MFDPSPLPDGAITPWNYAYTSNALVRREALPDKVAPFSTRFDLTGGSDIDLFKRMIELGVGSLPQKRQSYSNTDQSHEQIYFGFFVVQCEMA